LTGRPMIDIFGLTILLDAVLFSVFVPICLFIYNLSHLSKKEMKEEPKNLFIGYKLDKSELQGKHVKVVSESNGTVWVMPLLPFMLPITAGFFSAVFYGNILDSIIIYLLTSI
jgi:preflagellin peptidase FlaK